jgi:hypothetical protein
MIARSHRGSPERRQTWCEGAAQNSGRKMDGLQPKRRRRYVITTNSDHESPIFPNLARDQKIDGPNQLWVADIT